MKSALSLTSLIVCVIGASLPATAQEPTGSSFGPIARAITPEAIRLAAEPAVETAQQRGTPAQSNWSRVRTLQPETELVVTVTGSSPAKRYLLAADDTGLTVLNLTDPMLPPAVRGALRDHLTAHNAEHFLAAQKGGTFLLDKNVRLEPGGVYVADQKVAALGQIIERTARTDVVEIRGESARRHPAVWGALIGAATGLGVALASGAGANLCGSDGCYGGLVMALLVGGGAGAGAGVGAAIGASHQAHDEVIYRAP